MKIISADELKDFSCKENSIYYVKYIIDNKEEQQFNFKSFKINGDKFIFIYNDKEKILKEEEIKQISEADVLEYCL